MYLRITNSGEIELAALFLVGASTKEGDSTKIGFFGSGNKYAMSTLLRNGIAFRIYSGLEAIDVSTKHVEFRGEAFDQIYLNGTPTSFTTRMGPTWEVWFALREFVCNALDEGGFEIALTSEIAPEAGKTSIYIEAKADVMHFFKNLDNYIYLGEPLFEADTNFGRVAIIKDDATELGVFRKGIRVLPTSTKRRALFHYNFDEIEINESRVYVYEYQLLERMAAALTQAPVAIVERFIDHCRDDGLVEHNLPWNYVAEKLTSAWAEVLDGRTVMYEKHVTFAPAEDVLDSVVLTDVLVSKIAQDLPNVSIWGITGGEYTEIDDPTGNIERARQAVIGFGYLDDSAIVKSVKFFNPKVIGLYTPNDEVIAIAASEAGDYNELLSTMLEEALHRKGYHDGTRDYEQFLTRELVAAKLKLTEE